MNVNKLICLVALLATISFGFCDFGSLKYCEIVGGHYEGTYYFSGHGYRTFTFGSWCPSSIQYNFWVGRVCRY